MYTLHTVCVLYNLYIYIAFCKFLRNENCTWTKHYHRFYHLIMQFLFDIFIQDLLALKGMSKYNFYRTRRGDERREKKVSGSWVKVTHYTAVALNPPTILNNLKCFYLEFKSWIIYVQLDRTEPQFAFIDLQHPSLKIWCFHQCPHAKASTPETTGSIESTLNTTTTNILMLESKITC